MAGLDNRNTCRHSKKKAFTYLPCKESTMIIPESTTFDQRTMTLLMEHDPLVQGYRAFFALFDWRVVPELPQDPSRPGKRPHPQSAYVKALLLKIEQGLASCTQLRRFLVAHPLLGL